jgi:hypothetical protein
MQYLGNVSTETKGIVGQYPEGNLNFGAEQA